MNLTDSRISGSFPAKDVEACIRDALADQEASQELLRSRPRGACEPEVDSLVVIDVICAIEELLGVSLPTSFAPRGGYEDVESCVSDLVAQANAVWKELVKEDEEAHA